MDPIEDADFDLDVLGRPGVDVRDPVLALDIEVGLFGLGGSFAGAVFALTLEFVVIKWLAELTDLSNGLEGKLFISRCLRGCLNSGTLLAFLDEKDPEPDPEPYPDPWDIRRICCTSAFAE